MKHLVIFLLIGLTPIFGGAQESYNNCSDALEICPSQTYSINNLGANTTLCPDCEDDFAFCFVPNNSIWLTFTTNATGGDVQLDFSNVVFETNPGQDSELQATLIQANIPCNAASYTQVGNCENAATGFFTLTAPALPPSTIYYVVITGDENGVGVTSAAEATMEVLLSGPGVNRPTPSMSVAASLPFCQNETGAVHASTVFCDDIGTFNWYVNGVLTAVSSDSSFYSSELQDGDVVTVETSCFTLCPVTLSQSTSPIPVTSFVVDAGEDITIQEGETVLLNGQTTVTDFIWTPDYALSDPSVLNPVANPSETTVYTLTAMENGCTISDFVTVHVESDLFIPNTFSPNGDGDNDTWVILGIEKYPDCLLTIYDRWGQRVFQATGYSGKKAWDGNGKAGMLNEGVYFYEMQLRDTEKQVLKGSITLIR